MDAFRIGSMKKLDKKFRIGEMPRSITPGVHDLTANEIVGNDGGVSREPESQSDASHSMA